MSFSYFRRNICWSGALSRILPDLLEPLPHIGNVYLTKSDNFQTDHYLFTIRATMTLAEQTDTNTKATLPALRPTSILHRTPWRPPVAISGKGIYITLEDGRKVIDAVGGASVACIGHGHPDPLKAIKEQVDKVSCA